MKKSTLLTVCLVVCLLALAGASWFMFGGSLGYSYAEENKYSVGNAKITGTVDALDIHWIDGSVTVQYHDSSEILVEETSRKNLGENDKLRWRVDGSTLRIQYAKPGLRFSFSLDKALTITLPKGLQLKDASLEGTSADLNPDGLAADRITLKTTSGDVRGSVATPDLRGDCTSGDVRLTVNGKASRADFETTSGTLALAFPEGCESVRMDTTSGNIFLDTADTNAAEISSTSGTVSVKAGALKELKSKSTSGDVTLTVPAEPGFTCEASMTSGSFSSGIPVEQNGKTYSCGDKSAHYKISTTSGNIRIEPAE